MHGSDPAEDLRDLVLTDVCQPIGDEKRHEFVEAGDAVSVVDLLQGQLGAVETRQTGEKSG